MWNISQLHTVILDVCVIGSVIKDLILRAFMLPVFVISLCTHDIVLSCHVAIPDFSDILVAMANRKTFLQLKLY